jgi:YD repeat-containing protein
LGKVDLGLQEAQGSFSPSNPIVPLILPSSASEPIGIGNDGLSLMPEGASSDATARVFDEEALFLPDAFADTSLLLSPVSGGVELSAMLASPASPEQIAFAVSLPKNAQLRASEEGGAEVIGPDGEVLYLISPPRALDAQGTTVPVSLEVQSDSVILNMPHRQLDLAYPLYVDPEVIENWSGFADTSKLNYWSWQYSGVPSAETYIGQRWPIVDNWGNGLYVRSRSETSYPAGSWGRWWLSPPGSTSYMRRVILGPIHYDAHGCTANEPHPYVGVWNDYSGWKALSNAYPTSWGNWIDTGEGNLGAGTRTAFVGIEAAGAVNLKCGHDYALNGATLYLTDPENPTLGSVAGLPGGWFNDSSPFTVNVPVNDPGLGVKQATLSGAGAVPQEQKLGCSGTFASPCPPSYTFPFTFSAKSLDEGEKNVQISGKDVLDKYSNTLTLTSKVDRSEPVVNLNGQLAEATDETEGDEKDTTGIDPLSLPVYNLNIEATDGSITADPKTKRSGVKSIEVFLDEEKVPKEAWSNASCPQSSCSLAPTFVLKLNTLVALSTHTLHVVVRDFAGNQRTRNVGFRYVPATGIKDDYIMQHFPLDDGTGNEAEEEDPRRPELAVNLMNGNLVYRERDVDVPGPAVDLEVERFYNSLLPDSQNSEWGDGWTLGQTPTLEPEESGTPPTEATMVRTSGVVQSAVQLPTKVEGEHFDPQLHAVVTKEPGGGYEVTDASGESESSLDFNAAGQMTEMRTPGYASIDYGYEAGDLDEIAVDDPASAPMSAEVLDNLREEPTEWSLQTTPNPTPPKTNAELTDVACSSATACLAVGYDNANGRGLAEFWNGTTWTQKSGSAGRRQKAVACGAPEKCWVLATTSSGLSRAELWEGGSWEEVEAAPATPTGGSSVTLNAISCTAALTCTAVGSYVKESKTLPLIERLNNYSFSVQTPTTTTTSSLKDVSCVSATECVAIGSGGGKLFAERWNGTSWTTTAAPPNPAPYMPTYTTLTDLSCASSTSCVAIGSFTPDKEGEEFRWFADRWNGSTWSASGTGATGGEALNDITCTSSTSCIATGTESGKTLVKTWNGTSWSTQTSPNPSGKTPVLLGVACSSGVACTTVGRATGGGETVTVGERWNGTSWSLQSTPNPTPPKTNAELTDVACSSATACLAVGYDNANGRGLAEFWNGTTWTQKSGSAGRRQKAVACGAPEKCWVLATTSSGLSRAELWEGGSWEEVEAAPATPTGGSSVTLNAISCTAALTCTAVGSYVKESKTLPLIERLNNYSFSVQTPTTTTTSSLKDVSCVSATECVAIGSGGGKLFAERWNGTSWTTTAAPPNPAPYMPTYTTLTDLSCASSTSCVAIGSFTPDKEGEEFRWFADRWNGSTWSASGTGATGGEALNDITCTSSTSCIATGTESGKTLVKTWNGTSWSTQTSPNPSGKTPVLSAISCTTPISCTIAGRATGGGEVVTLAGRTVLRPEPTPEADPSVDISVSGGLVQALGGDESGEHDYQHSGNLLTAHEAPNGDYAYAYDASKRMTKVTLPNGTYAEVAYEPAYGRVKSVTVAPKGSNPKTTYFNYEDAPQRRTTVTPPIPSPVTTYEFGPNGGAIEWWNTVEPPGIHLAGDLADIQGRETVAPIAVGVHSLEVKGHSEEGIASIQIVANNNVLLSEQTCAQVPGPPVECVDKSDEWVTETGNWPPGILYLEAIVTDARGGKASERFWVNIPYTPPPESETDEPPKFEDILHFREEFGLDLDIQDDEQAINNRIFDLMGAWDNPLTSAGEVARATEARWGVPMRAVDAGEMEYREQYVDQAATALPQWAEHHAATSAYAGYYVDHRAGGVLYVGFTSNQEALVNELQKSGELIAPARIKGFPTHPTQSLPDLNALQVAVSEDSEPGGRLSRVGIEVAQNKVSVGTPEPGAVKSALLNQFGASAPLDVYEESKGIGPKGTYRERASGPVKAGDLLRSEVPVVQECTTGFGAWDSSGTNPSGQAIFRQFILTAGHCFAEGAPVINWKLSPDGKTEIGKRELGYVRRRTYLTTGGGFMVDAEAARLNSPAFVPRLIYYSANQSIRIDSAVSPKLGMVLCFSGNVSNHVKCGRVLGPPEAFSYYEDGPEAPMMWQVPFSVRSLHGDSGAPVWEAGSGHAVGLLTSGVEPKHVGELGPEIADVTPLLPSPGHPAAPGVLNAEGSSSGGSLGLVQWKP